MKFFDRIKEGLKKTRERLRSGLASLFRLRRPIDPQVLEELEEILYSADVGGEEVARVMERLQAAHREKRMEDTDQLLGRLKEELKVGLQGMDSGLRWSAAPPTVLLVVGVNGSGKTTTIAKLGKRFQDEGKKVVFAACDTFRAAAMEQLQIWADRLGIDLVHHQQGADPASVAFDAVQAALSRKTDVLIIDTAGRLHTKDHLMRELDKVVRVVKKKLPDAPHETLLVLDATTGQNALTQAKTFREMIGLTGVVMAKLDGTAKGGIVFAIYNQLQVPVKFVGLGEKMEDLEAFDPAAFVEGMFGE
ncbi:MAG: signal recognition particle-docking protein FtsY [Planctomycetes bacterium]|nr:signal recognition particle-docking protein FtsY [Planctomycetota bacterium]